MASNINYSTSTSISGQLLSDSTIYTTDPTNNRNNQYQSNGAQDNGNTRNMWQSTGVQSSSVQETERPDRDISLGYPPPLPRG